MAFEVAVRVDMRDIDAKCYKVPRHQDSAMAFKRFFFSAHNGNSKIVLDSTEHALKAASKQLGFRKSLVPHFPIFVARRIITACSEFLPQEAILDAMCQQSLFQLLAIELRINAAVRF